MDNQTNIEITWSSAWKIGCAVWLVPVLVAAGILLLIANGAIQFG